MTLPLIIRSRRSCPGQRDNIVCVENGLQQALGSQTMVNPKHPASVLFALLVCMMASGDICDSGRGHDVEKAQYWKVCEQCTEQTSERLSR